MKIILVIGFISLGVQVFSQQEFIGRDTTIYPNLVYNNLDLNWVINEDDYKFLDNLNNKYTSRESKLNILDSLYGSFRKSNKRPYEISYFICQHYVFENDSLVRFKLIQLLNALGTENWNSGFCHFYPFVFYKEFEVKLSLQERINLYDLILQFQYPQNLFSDEDKKFIGRLKKSIIVESGGKILN